MCVWRGLGCNAGAPFLDFASVGATFFSVQTVVWSLFLDLDFRSTLGTFFTPPGEGGMRLCVCV